MHQSGESDASSGVLKVIRAELFCEIQAIQKFRGVELTSILGLGMFGCRSSSVPILF